MPSDLESGRLAPAKASSSSKSKNLDELPISLKVNFEDVVRRHKLSLRDMGAATLEPKIREFLEVPEDEELLLERYSDSAGAFITLDDQNQAVYKQLYRAAKAKQKLKLRVTKKSPLLQTKPSTPRSVTVEDVPEAKPVAPVPQATLAPLPWSFPGHDLNEPSTSDSDNKRSTIHDVLRNAEPSASLDTSSAALPATDTGFDFETSLLTSLMDRHNLGGDVFQCNPRPQPEPVEEKAVPTICGNGARDDWFARAASGSLSSGFCPRRVPGVLSYAVCCNSCDTNIPDTHYHCSTCDDGDFDLCQSCVNEGVTCHGESHWLIKRVLKNGQIVTSTTETIAPKPKKKEEESKPVPKTEPKQEEEPFISPFTYTIRTCNSCVNDLPEHNFLHCTVCEDFDLCQSCFAKDNHGHTPKHAFLPAVAGSYVPNHIKIRLAPGRNQMHNAICDGCDKYVTGVRHKCLDCPDWDYCGECILNAKFVHAGHRFAPIYEPLEEVRPRSGPMHQTHFGICCDGPLCKTSEYIQGVRYKCTICHDTDFCASCEASPANSHNKTHPLIKFKTPVRHCTVATHAERGDGQQLPQMGDRNQSAAKPRRSDKTSIASVQTVVDVKPTEAASPKQVVVEKPHVAEPEVKKDAPVAAKAPLTEKDLNAVFVRDTVADGSVLPPNHAFEQTWYLRNDGDIAWPAGCAVKFVGGDYMGHLDPNQPAGISELVSASESITCYEALPPGKEFAFTVLLRTPASAGKFISYWRLTTKDGMKFGHRLWCDVKVEALVSEPTPEPRAEETEEMSKEEPQGSQMIFPKLEKESPISSIHQDTEDHRDVKSETTSAPTLNGDLAEVDDFDDCGDAEWDGSDEGFMTDEEYDILDASDEEYLEEQQKKKLHK